MNRLVRFGISLEEGLLRNFDRLIRQRGYGNRSEAIRDLIRADLVSQEWREGGEVVGVVMTVFDHHRRNLLATLTDVQHESYSRVLASQHIHLDHDHCLETAIVRGKREEVEELANRLKALKGVKHAALVMTTTGKKID